MSCHTLIKETTAGINQSKPVKLLEKTGAGDWSRKNPWRAPGTAPVYGSGCGVYGGRKEFNGRVGEW